MESASVSFVSAFLPSSAGMGVSWSPQGSAGAIASSLSSQAAAQSTLASVTATLASYERREQEWRFQMNLSQRDIAISAQQITSAQNRKNVVNQELSIANIQNVNANATVNFLTTKRFATSELYEWMSGVLGRVYGYFLQQATATARLAQNQLAFERQEGVLSLIQFDYWQPPSDNGTTVNGSDGTAPDRRGITGSARLLQDIYQLDQHAFETDKRDPTRPDVLASPRWRLRVPALPRHGRDALRDPDEDVRSGLPRTLPAPDQARAHDRGGSGAAGPGDPGHACDHAASRACRLWQNGVFRRARCRASPSWSP